MLQRFLGKCALVFPHPREIGLEAPPRAVNQLGTRAPVPAADKPWAVGWLWREFVTCQLVFGLSGPASGSGKNAYEIFLIPTAARSGAAARSANIEARSCRIPPAGIEASPWRRRTSISTFSLPVTNQRIRRARLMPG